MLVSKSDLRAEGSLLAEPAVQSISAPGPGATDSAQDTMLRLGPFQIACVTVLGMRRHLLLDLGNSHAACSQQLRQYLRCHI